MKDHLFALLLLSVILVGCDSSTSPSTHKDVLVPFFAGRTWCYDVENPQDKSDTSFFFQDYCDSVEYGRSVDDEVWYSLASEFYPFWISYVNRADGLWMLSGGGITGHISRTLLFPFPAEVGTSLTPDTNDHRMVDSTNGWYEYYDTVAGAVTLVEKDVILKVPAGSFSCYHYQKQMKNIRTGAIYSQEDNYYCANTGLIQSEAYDSDSLGNLIPTYITKLKRMNWK